MVPKAIFFETIEKRLFRASQKLFTVPVPLLGSAYSYRTRHPFSIASTESDDYLEFHIAVQGSCGVLGDATSVRVAPTAGLNLPRGQYRQALALSAFSVGLYVPAEHA